MGFPVGFAVAAGQTVGIVLGVDDGFSEFVECALTTGYVIDAPEIVGGDVAGERANLRLRVGGEDIGSGVGTSRVFESEDEFTHAIV